MMKLFLIIISLLMILLLLSNCKNEDNDNVFTNSTPEKEGLDSKVIYNYVKDMNENAEVQSFVLIRNKKIVFESYSAPFQKTDLHELYSSTKSVTSILIGIAIDEGKINIDDKVLTYFKNENIKNIDSLKENMIVKDLLTMTAGLDWKKDGDSNSSIHMLQSDNWANYTLGLKMIHEPGNVFTYSNGVSHVLGVILQKATGKTLEQYAKEKLFTPLEIENYKWKSNISGESVGSSGLWLNSIDFCKIGQLYLNEGSWNGKQIVSKKWVKESTKEHINNNQKSYGYQWWIRNDCSEKNFYAAGQNRQRCFVFPEKNIILTFFSSFPLTGMEYKLEVGSFVTEMIKSDNEIKENLEYQSKLNTLVNNLAENKSIFEDITFKNYQESVNMLSCRKIIFDSNTSGIENLNIDFIDEESATVELSLNDNLYKFPIGLNGKYKISSQRDYLELSNISAHINYKFSFNDYQLIGYGYWEDENKFNITFQILGDGIKHKYLIDFSNEDVKIDSYYSGLLSTTYKGNFE